MSAIPYKHERGAHQPATVHIFISLRRLLLSYINSYTFENESSQNEPTCYS